jgi:hypothetical protein
MIDTESEPGAWQRAIDRGCLSSAITTEIDGTEPAVETPGGVCPPLFQHPAGLCLTQHDGEA